MEVQVNETLTLALAELGVKVHASTVLSLEKTATGALCIADCDNCLAVVAISEDGTFTLPILRALFLISASVT
jgi:hypothetical protein